MGGKGKPVDLVASIKKVHADFHKQHPELTADEASKQLMGICDKQTAGGPPAGPVEPQHYGLCVLLSKPLVKHPKVKSLIGANKFNDDDDLRYYVGDTAYYDDDDWQPYNEAKYDKLSDEEHDALSEEDHAKLGIDLAVVYFSDSDPLEPGRYHVVPHFFLRPATEEECLLYGQEQWRRRKATK